MLLLATMETRPVMAMFAAVLIAHEKAQAFYWGNFKRIAAVFLVYATTVAVFG
jgi:hypothetical protein